MRPFGVFLLAVATGSGFAQTGSELKLPKHDPAQVKRPEVVLAIRSLAARLEDWSPLAKPEGYDTLSKALVGAIDKGDWSEATVLARRVREMIPETVPQDDYPWSLHSRSSYDAAIGELLVLQGRYGEAETTYRKLLIELPKETQSPSRATAAAGLAGIEANRLRSNSAKILREQAAQEYWSGCGNCEEGEEMWNHLRNTVGQASATASAAAVARLHKLVAGGFKPFPMRLMRDGDGYQRKAMKVLAAYNLGLVYQRLGKREKAKDAFAFCVASNNAAKQGIEESLWAWEQLQRIKRSGH